MTETQDPKLDMQFMINFIEDDMKMNDNIDVFLENGQEVGLSTHNGISIFM